MERNSRVMQDHDSRCVENIESLIDLFFASLVKLTELLDGKDLGEFRSRVRALESIRDDIEIEFESRENELPIRYFNRVEVIRALTESVSRLERRVNN